MSCVAFEDVPIDDFNPDYYHCNECGYDNPIEFVTSDGYLWRCLKCGIWQEDE